MDVYEATGIVLMKIQRLDPENASKIMGFLLIQDHGEMEVIRLAFGSESLIHSVVLKARNELGISSNTLIAPSSPSSASPFLYNPLSPQNYRPSPLFYGGGATADLIDEVLIQEKSDLFHRNWPGTHRRSYSVSDVCVGPDDTSSKSCLFYARGYCKNGTDCRFLHDYPIGDSAGEDAVYSPTEFEAVMNSTSSFPQSPSSFANKYTNFLLHQDMDKFRRIRLLERTDLAAINGGSGMMNHISRQIYLTFPADSSFREEDVSNYFSIYGPVQDVRIPYQQKRMFGFVTFVYPETVKLILAKGNPHFICDCRVLVKPYKEKGKILDKFRRHEQLENGDYSSGFDSRTHFDIPIGPRMFLRSQELLRRKKVEEEAELQQAIELQAKRLMGLQFLDLKRQNHQQTMSSGAGAGGGGLSSPTSHFCRTNQMNCLTSSSKTITHEEESESPESSSSSLEFNLPDNPFASHRAASSSAGEYVITESATGSAAVETDSFMISSSSFVPASGMLTTLMAFPCAKKGQSFDSA